MNWGIFFILGGSILFSAKAVVVKLTYLYSISALTSLFFRMLMAFPFLVWIAVREEKKQGKANLTAREWVHVWAMGILGYYAASYFDFLGLQYITAGLERIILFLYPTLVVVLSFLFLGKKMETRELVSLGLTYIGVGVSYGADVKIGGDPVQVSLGAGFIFLSALSYAFYLIGSGSLVPKLGSLRFTSWALLISSLLVFLQFAFLGSYSELFQTLPFYGLVFLLGTIHTVIPAVFVSEGIRRVGSKTAAIVASIGPISTLVLAFFLLGEPITPWQLVGTFFVLSGVFWISYGKT